MHHVLRKTSKAGSKRPSFQNRGRLLGQRIWFMTTNTKRHHWVGSVLDRSLDDRLVYRDYLGDLFVDADLAENLRLLERFPDLRFYK
jgi:hypothetical protein